MAVGGGGVSLGGFGVAVGCSVGGGSDGTSDGATLGDSDGGAGGQGSAATADPSGVGMANDGTTPLGSGVGVTKHVGEGCGPHLPPTRTPHDAPNGRYAPL